MYEGRQGYANWSLGLLAGKVVELGDKPRNGEADAKENGFSCKRKVQYRVIPPESGVRGGTSA